MHYLVRDRTLRAALPSGVKTYSTILGSSWNLLGFCFSWPVVSFSGSCSSVGWSSTSLIGAASTSAMLPRLSTYGRRGLVVRQVNGDAQAWSTIRTRDMLIYASLLSQTVRGYNRLSLHLLLFRLTRIK